MAVLATGVDVPAIEANLPVVKAVLVKAKVLPVVVPGINRKDESPSILSSAVK